MQCQAVGCTADLTADGKYCMKRRLCRFHLKADSVLRKKGGTELWRFCQQCGKLEPLTFFDGCKRSCRVQLERRRQSQSLSNVSKKGRTSNPGTSQRHVQLTSASAETASASVDEESASQEQVSLWMQQLAELREKQQRLEQQVMSQLAKQQQQSVYGRGIDAAIAAEAAALAGCQDSQLSQPPSLAAPAGAGCQDSWPTQPSSLAATAGSGCQDSWITQPPSLAAAAGSGYQDPWLTQPSGLEQASPAAVFEGPWGALLRNSSGISVGTGSDMASMLQVMLHRGQGVSQMQDMPPAAAAMPAGVSACMAADLFHHAPVSATAPTAEGDALHNLQLAALMRACIAAGQPQTGQHPSAAQVEQSQQQLVAAGLIGDAHTSSLSMSAAVGLDVGLTSVSCAQLQGTPTLAPTTVHTAGLLGVAHGMAVTGCTGYTQQHAASSNVAANHAAFAQVIAQQSGCSPVGKAVAAGSRHLIERSSAGDLHHMGATSAAAPAAAMTDAIDGDASMSLELDSFMSLLEQVPAAASAKGLNSVELAGIIQAALDEVRGSTHQQQESKQRLQQQSSVGIARKSSGTSTSPFAAAAVQETKTASQADATNAASAADAGAATSATAAVADITPSEPVDANRTSAPLAAAPTHGLSARLLSLLAPAATRQQTLDIYGALLASMPGAPTLESYMSIMLAPNSLDSMAQLESALMEAVAEPPEGLQAAGDVEAIQPVIVPVWKEDSSLRQKLPEAAAPVRSNLQSPVAAGLNSCSMLDAQALHERVLPPSPRCNGGGGATAAGGWGVAAAAAADVAAAPPAVQPLRKPKCMTADWKLEWD